MSFLSFFWPIKIAQYSSKYNSQIDVIEFYNKKYINVGGLMQSGSFVARIFDKGMSKLNIQEKLPDAKKILVLGLGAGSVLEPLRKRYPYANFTGIDIDVQMIAIGKKYFSLETFTNLNIIVGNALNQKLNIGDNYDLIFVDIYQGKQVPQKLENSDFLKYLYKLKSKKGVVIFNRLYYQKHIFEANQFLDKCKKLFNDITTAKIYSNLLICIK